jgi:HAD superfamily hydrolase (TIGR01490 family)
MVTPSKKYVAFFDLDKTVLSINSGSVLVREAYKNGLMNTSDLLHAIYLSWLYKFNLRDTTIIISGMGRWLKGKTTDEVKMLSEHVVNKYLIDSIRPEIKAEIRFHKEQNAEIVILSSVMVEICTLLGSHLETDNYICTQMEVTNGVFTGLPENKFCFDDEKRVRLLDYCEIKNHNPGEAFYFGDSISDLRALEVVGHPVCVAPDKKLAAIARKRGWRII